MLGPILDALIRTLPRDNLLCSACLDLFALILKENTKELIKHLAEKYRDKIIALTYIDLFRDLLERYDQSQGYALNGDSYFVESDDDITAARRPPGNVGGRGGEQLAIDEAQEAYWNTSDDEDENQNPANTVRPESRASNGSSKPLVEYTSDEEEDAIMTPVGSASDEGSKENQQPPATPTMAPVQPPERLSEKRRREEEDDDALEKLTQNKRRNSSSAGSNSSVPGVSPLLKKKGSFNGGGNKSRSREGSPAAVGLSAKKIAISISPSIKTAVVKATLPDVGGAEGGETTGGGGVGCGGDDGGGK